MKLFVRSAKMIMLTLKVARVNAPDRSRAAGSALSSLSQATTSKSTGAILPLTISASLIRLPGPCLRYLRPFPLHSRAFACRPRDMAAYKLVLIRHGESCWNQENRFCGWFDADLSETGEEEARRGGQALKGDPVIKLIFLCLFVPCRDHRPVDLISSL